MGHIVKYFDLRVRGPPLPPPPGPSDHFRPSTTFGPPSDKWIVCDWREDNPGAWQWRLVTLEGVLGVPDGHLPSGDFVMAPAKRKEGIDITVNIGRGEELIIPNVHFFGRVWPSE